jgi:hypothetical protein
MKTNGGETSAKVTLRTYREWFGPECTILESGKKKKQERVSPVVKGGPAALFGDPMSVHIVLFRHDPAIEAVPFGAGGSIPSGRRMPVIVPIEIDVDGAGWDAMPTSPTAATITTTAKRTASYHRWLVGTRGMVTGHPAGQSKKQQRKNLKSSLAHPSGVLAKTGTSGSFPNSPTTERGSLRWPCLRRIG